MQRVCEFSFFACWSGFSPKSLNSALGSPPGVRAAVSLCLPGWIKRGNPPSVPGWGWLWSLWSSCQGRAEIQECWGSPARLTPVLWVTKIPLWALSWLRFQLCILLTHREVLEGQGSCRDREFLFLPGTSLQHRPRAAGRSCSSNALFRIPTASSSFKP